MEMAPLGKYDSFWCEPMKAATLCMVGIVFWLADLGNAAIFRWPPSTSAFFSQKIF
jgi:hypothetical protein